VHQPDFGDQNEPENRLENFLQIHFKNQPMIGLLFSAQRSPEIGGVNEYDWTTANPEKVSCIYADGH